MIFKDSTKFDSYYFPFNWGAEYTKGEYLTEFDLETKEKNDFYDIQQNRLIRFGLYGCGLKFFYNQDGSFNLAGQHITIEYHLGEEIFDLTSSQMKKDCIAYKQKEMMFHPDLSLQADELVSIDFGYKTLLNFNGKQIFFKPIVKLPVNQAEGKVQIEVTMTSNLDLDGKLVFKNRGMIMDSGETPLRQNKSTTVNWIVH